MPHHSSLIVKLATQKSSYTLALAAVLLFSLLVADHCRANPHFPTYPAIRHNVAFWEQIYANHSINSAVIHDRNDLSKIYAKVALDDEDLPGARQANARKLTAIEDRYSELLRQLAQGKKPVLAEEKRVAAMFTGPNARNRLMLAADNIRSQRGQKERFQEGVIRSGAYMTAIRRIFSSHGLPAELAYLPHVESSFNVQAYSKDGAAGIWQFTRSTGKQYLRIDAAIDERLDPLIAANAAARYLKNSHQALDNWPLALTSYNYGTAGMVRAKNALGDYERVFREYNEGHFKFASRNFYSEFLAAVKVAQRLESNPAIRLAQPHRSTTHVIPGFIHIKEIQHHFGVSTEAIRQLNPALRPPVFTGEKYLPKGYALRLPAKGSNQLAAATPPPLIFKARQKESPKHLVKHGETASSIARRYRISLQQLIKANALDRRGTIFVGQKLTIPSKTAKSSASNEMGTKKGLSKQPPSRLG